MTDEITFTYNHCDQNTLHKDLNFNEEKFAEILMECFEVEPNTISLDVTFEANKAQATGKFSCAINIITAGHTHYVKEVGEDDFSKVATLACHKAVKIVRADKTKVQHEELDIPSDTDLNEFNL